MNDYSNIPEVLKDQKRWVGWKYAMRNVKKTKVPIDAMTGGNAKSNEPLTWTSFGNAVSAAKRCSLDGIGIMLGDGLFGVDLDHVIDRVTGEVDAQAAHLVESLNSYTETSPSGEGLHILCFGKLPEGGRRKGNIEMYDSGRYFTVTGAVYGDYEQIRECSGEIERVHGAIFEVQTTPSRPAAVLPGTLGRAVSPACDQPLQRGEYPNNKDQDETVMTQYDRLLARIRRSAGGEKFDRLYAGNWQGEYQSQSEADLALCCMLAFWTGRDAGTMDCLFRSSGLMRAKWNRGAGQGMTYGQRTLKKAVEKASTVYEPNTYPQVVNSVDNVEKIQIYSQDDEGNALRLLDIYGRDMHWSFVHSLWYVWTGRQWREDMTGRVFRLARSVTAQLEKEMQQRPDDRQFIYHVRRSRNKQGIESMLSQMRSMPGVPVLPGQMDRDDWMINCINGTVDLKAGNLREHRREDLITRIAPVKFDEDAKCPRWEDFLIEIMGGQTDMVRYLQMAVGYSLTGSTSEQCMFILYGSGANGKSTFLEMLSAMFGGYCMNAQPDTLMVKRQAGSATADIARLQGARLVTTVEPDERCRLHEGAVKQLTGGDPVTCRFLYGKEFEYTPGYKIWMATNHKPGVRGTDDGIWRRMRLIPFEIKIPQDKQDKALSSKLKAELSGILAWAVRGCLDWQKNGLVSPAPVIEATREYRGEMDQLASFCQECISPVPGAFLPSSEIYGAYRAWAAGNGEYALSHRTFSIKLAEKGIERGRTSNRKGFEGIAFTSYGAELARKAQALP